MKKITKKFFLSLSMIMVMLISCLVNLPANVLAATDVPYLDASGALQNAPSAVEITSSTDELTAGWYVVTTDVNRVGTIEVTGDVHLILADGGNLTITGDNGHAGINVKDTNSLSIYNQIGHTGVLSVIGGQNGAGIGSGFKENGGAITINGGIINATGGLGVTDNSNSSIDAAGAGIGDGGSSEGIKIVINGGDINATGGNGDESTWTGAGIGGSESNVTITGGTITATGGKNEDGLEVIGGAGIGGSGKTFVNTITISGGSVTATGGPGAAGIGGSNSGETGGTIIISGGNINATGGNFTEGNGFSYGGTGIGSGFGAYSYDDEYKTTITISGTSVVKATGGALSAGIGSGSPGESEEGVSTTSITIDGGTVTGIGGVGGAGIGGGLMVDGGIITIKNGTVVAIGGKGNPSGGMPFSSAAGIGGGGGIGTEEGIKFVGSGGTISISGGLVFAQGATLAKDIGGGTGNNDGTLAISGTSAVFLRNDASVEPVTTTTHTHKNIINHVANASAYGIPIGWDGDFGAWLVLSSITFDSAGGSEVARIDQHVNTSVTAPANPTREGYSFGGWEPVLPKTMPVNDLMVVAKWTKDAATPGASEPGKVESESTESNVTNKPVEELPNTGDSTTYLFNGIALILLAAGLYMIRISNRTKERQ